MESNLEFRNYLTRNADKLLFNNKNNVWCNYENINYKIYNTVDANKNENILKPDNILKGNYINNNLKYLNNNTYKIFSLS